MRRASRWIGGIILLAAIGLLLFTRSRRDEEPSPESAHGGKTRSEIAGNAEIRADAGTSGQEPGGQRRAVEATDPVAESGAEVASGEIHLRVVYGRNGTPAADIRCELPWDGTHRGELPSALTGTDGTCVLRHADGRSIEGVRIHCSERQVVDHYLFQELRAGTPIEVLVTLPMEGVLRGRVIDPRGNGIPGCAVTGGARYNVGGAPRRLVPDQVLAHSGAGGRFEVSGLVGRFRLRCELADHHALNELDGELAAGEQLEHLILVLASSREVRGTVTDPTGVPVFGARIGADLDHVGVGRSHGLAQPLWVDEVALTDAEGHFCLADLPRVPLNLVLWHQRHLFHVEALPAEADRCDIELGPAHALAQVGGVVRNSAGAPVPGAQIDARFHTRHPQTQTGEGGEFDFEVLLVRDPALDPLPSCQLFVHAARHAPTLMSLDNLAPGLNRYEIELEPERELAGVVLDAEDRPVEGAYLWLSSSREVRPGWDWLKEMENASHRSDADGRFRIGSLWEDRFKLRASGRDHASAAGLQVSSGRTDLILRLLPALSGDAWPPAELVVFRTRVVDALTGAPIERYMAKVFTPGRGGGGSTRQAPDGERELNPRPPGDYIVSIEAEGYARAHLPERSWPAGVHELHFALKPSAPLRLRCVDATGAPVAGVVVLPFDLDGQGLSWDKRDASFHRNEWPKTGYDGRCWFESLPRGPLRLELTGPGEEPSRWVEVDLATQGLEEVEVRL